MDIILTTTVVPSQPITSDEILQNTSTSTVDGPFTIIQRSRSLPKPLSFLDDEAKAFPAASNTIEDEIPPSNQVQTIGWNSRSFIDDEIIPVSLIDDESFTILITYVTYPKTFAFTDDEILPTSVTFGLDQQEPWIAQSESISWNNLSFRDDEILSIFTTPHFDQEEFWTPQYEAVTWTPKPFLDDEIGSQLKFFYLEQEEFWTAQYETVSWTPRPYLDDEISSGLFTPFGLEQEEFWTAQFEVVPWNNSYTRDDETGSGLFIPFGLDADSQTDWNKATEIISWNATTFLDEPAISIFGIEDVQPFTAQYEIIAWNQIAFTDEHALVQQPFGLLDEPPWVATFTVIPWIPRPVLDDETGSQLIAYRVDDDTPWTSVKQTVVWTINVFSDTDDLGFVQFGPTTSICFTMQNVTTLSFKMQYPEC